MLAGHVIKLKIQNWSISMKQKYISIKFFSEIWLNQICVTCYNLINTTK